MRKICSNNNANDDNNDKITKSMKKNGTNYINNAENIKNNGEYINESRNTLKMGRD